MSNRPNYSTGSLCVSSLVDGVLTPAIYFKGVGSPVKNQQGCTERPESASWMGEGGDVGGQDASLAEFSAEEHVRLRRLRRQVKRGERSDYLPVDKRQDFIRWLVEQGKLSDS